MQEKDILQFPSVEILFAQKKAATIGFDGGVHTLDVSEADVFTNLVREHQPILAVLATRQRNLRIIFNVWQNKDVKVLKIMPACYN